MASAKACMNSRICLSGKTLGAKATVAAFASGGPGVGGGGGAPCNQVLRSAWAATADKRIVISANFFMDYDGGWKKAVALAGDDSGQ